MTCYFRKIKIRVCYYFRSNKKAPDGVSHKFSRAYAVFTYMENTGPHLWERNLSAGKRKCSRSICQVDRYAIAVEKANDIYCKLTQFSSLMWWINTRLLSFSLRAGTFWIQRRTYLTIGRLNRSRGDSIGEWSPWIRKWLGERHCKVVHGHEVTYEIYTVNIQLILKTCRYNFLQN